ncbi:MAG: hypothetical protein TREMPRED_000958 [Tremellales sp. Tagirdzhanova-0007]|nr:MAG: hypothetical protein TREMPRED_000958 [Tremellales sp. Tagirdzhanova-0007]
MHGLNRFNPFPTLAYDVHLLAHTGDLNRLARTSPDAADDIEWPESGPSEPSRAKAKISRNGAKVVAAMTGAMTTSLLSMFSPLKLPHAALHCIAGTGYTCAALTGAVTPFDVLKTRLQTFQPSTTISSVASTADCCQTTVLSPAIALSSQKPSPNLMNPLTCLNSAAASSHLTSGAPSRPHMSSSLIRSFEASAAALPPSGCSNPSKWGGMWGETLTFEQALARGMVASGPEAGASLVMPAGQSVTGAIGGFWSEVASIRRETGIRGLWKGVGTTLTMSIPSAAIYMLGYEHLLSFISPYFTGSTDPLINASSLHRRSTPSVTASLTPAPLFAGSMARTLSATVISPIEMFRTRLQASPTVETGTPTYASTAKEMGRLVKSRGPTILWRGLGPTLWRDVPFSGIYWAGFEILKSRLAKSGTSLTPITTSFISGAVSGTFAALLTQPFDVLKTRQQVFTASANGAPWTSTLSLAMHVIRTEGSGALFAGLTPRCGKVAPACGLMIACYEGVGRWLGGQED